MNKILLDGSKLSFDVAGGVVNYINNIFSHFQLLDTNYNVHSEIILLNRRPDGKPLGDLESEKRKRSVVKNYSQFAKLLLFGLSEEYVLFHSPYMFLPPKRKNKINILTVLDMINFERSFSVRNKLREQALRIAIKRADFYICISEATKEKLQFYFPEIKDQQIAVTYLGIEKSMLTAAQSTQFQNLTQSPYILYVGQRSGYKNFNSLIEFMATSNWGKKIKLLCVGGGKFTSDELISINNKNLSTEIIHVGYATTEDLKFLYQNAIALAYTSLAEGFGLPILEAMASGCPVICGNFSSMKEIAGGHAILVDDFSVSSVENAIERAEALTPKSIEDAKLYASGFTWEKTAINTLAIYKRLADSLAK